MGAQKPPTTTFPLLSFALWPSHPGAPPRPDPNWIAMPSVQSSFLVTVLGPHGGARWKEIPAMTASVRGAVCARCSGPWWRDCGPPAELLGKGVGVGWRA
mmetsp:Transcript_56774/g.93392  ORF Transcript_56774/g.93392 Transcript_56774/m.93392 type:complete len:100 (-) Transcript_56774:15-314(-)